MILAAIISSAIILADETTFTMKSVSEGEMVCTRTILVTGSAGDKAAVFMEYITPTIDLVSFSGEIHTDGDKPLKIKKKDLSSVSISSGLVEDGYVIGYAPARNNYPYTVTYTYKLQYKKGFAVFPAYNPIPGEKVALAKGEYRIVVPEGTVVRKYCSPLAGEAQLSHGKGTDIYTWTIENYPGYVIEHNMPPRSSLVPVILASPDVFMFDGYAGEQDSWASIGKWQWNLLKGTEQLPQACLADVDKLTAGVHTNLEKVRILYNYLREKTRYVSIQLGIGGFKPFSASWVDKMGYGDCKALSNYMRSLLNAAGIDSYYTVLNDDRPDFYPSYPSFGQTNHAMLAVPMPELRDTLWLECTSPSVPLGYRHRGIAGHQVVLIKDGAGELVRVGSYPDSISSSTLSLEVFLQADGGAHVDARRSETGVMTERWIPYESFGPDQWRSTLTRGSDVQPQNFALGVMNNNFQTYDGPGWKPLFEVNYSFDVRSFGRLVSGRMMIPVNPFSKILESQKVERVNPLVISGSYPMDDIIRIHIPDGYKVENIPNDVLLNQGWGSFSSCCNLSDDGKTLVVKQHIQLHSCVESPQAYDGFREFVKSINRSFAASVVLVRSEV